VADVSRLVLQVDASVELARRNLSALAAAVEGDSQKMDRSLRRVDEAHARLGRTTGTSRIAQQEWMHVIRASSDSVMAGTPILQAFGMEMGRIIEATRNSTGAIGTFGKYLQGPVGLGLSLVITLLGTLAIGHRGAGAAAVEHKTAEEKLKDAVKAVADATKNLNDNELITIQRHLDAARAAEAQAQSLIKVAQAKLALAKADLAAESVRANDPTQAQEGGINVNFDIAARRAREVQQITADIARLDAMAASAQRSAVEVEAKFGRILGEARSNPERSIDFQFNQRQILLNQDFRRRTAGRDVTPADREWMARQEAALSAAREKATQTAQAAAEAERKLSDNREQGRQVSLAEAESIVRGIGGRVTSAQRSTAEQAELYARYRAGTGSLAAAPGHSLHETGQALDIAKGGGMSLGRIREAFQARGIQIRELLDEGNHFHVGFGKAGPSQESTLRSAQAAADRKRHDHEDFSSAQSQASQRLAAAQEEAAKHSEDSLDLQIVRIGVEKQGLDEATRRNATEHRWSEAETKTVLELNRRWAQTRVATAIANDQAKSARDQLMINEAGIRNEQELVRAHADLAETTKERRDASVALLDLAQQAERLELEALLASKEATDAQKQIARARLAMLPQLRDLAVQSIDRQYEGAGAKFRRAVNSQDINEQLDQVKVRGLQSLEDELAGIVSGTESVSHAFKRMAQSIIADLARIAIEKEIILPLANMLFGGTGGGSGGVLAALGAGTGTMAGFAAGGDPPVGKWSLVGEKGPELIKPRAPMTVIPNHMLGRGGRGGGSAQPQLIVVQVDKSDLFNVHVDSRIGAHAPAIAGAAVAQVMKIAGRRGING
jgi:hypothetical protein